MDIDTPPACQAETFDLPVGNMKNTVTETLISTLVKRAAPGISQKDIDFLRAYYHRLSGQDFETSKASGFRHAALKHRRLSGSRRPGETIVSLYNIPAAQYTASNDRHKTIINIVVDDQPFVINSLLMKLNGMRKSPTQTLYPLFEVIRDKNGQAVSYKKSSAASQPSAKNRDGSSTFIESYMLFVIDYTPQSEHLAIAAAIKNVISEVCGVVTDWKSMRRHVLENAAAVESMNQGPAFAEYGELFRWMAEDHFAFLGYCELSVSGTGGNTVVELDQSSLLGTLRTIHENNGDKNGSGAVMDILPKIVFTKTAPVVFTKTRQRANIHRSAYMDCILLDHGAKNRRGRRKVSCLLGFLGGSTAALPTSDIPHLRNKTRHVLESSTLRKGGYSYKELRTVLETLPREKLFQMDMKSLYPLCMTLLNQERRKTRLHLHKNICGHYYSCLVYVPRDLFNSQLRSRIQDYLAEKLQAKEVEFDVYFSDSILTRIHYTIHTDPEPALEIDPVGLEKSVQQISRDWNDNLYEAANRISGHDHASTLLEKFRDGFGSAYQQDFNIDNAIADTAVFESLQGDNIHAVLSHANSPGADSGHASFKLYCHGSAIALSDVLPILENMGVRVIGGRPYRINTTLGNRYRILDFDIVRHDGQLFDFQNNAEKFESTFVKCWDNQVENDGFNQLTLVAGLGWRRISLVRAYYRYLRQIRLRYSESYIIDALNKNPPLIIAISSLFSAQFDPRKNAAEIGKHTDRVKQLLSQVSTLDEERIIRALLDVIAATLRTNYFQPAQDGSPKPYISFKLNSGAIPRIPQPIPRFEIFVYSPRVEGVHLRGGMIARGGLRWSERPEDFRTEVLGLVKAQRVKNAVIIPVGSKGGFVAKQLPHTGRDAVLDEVIACYKIFISSLLDITDNLSGSKVVPPANVRRLDGDDPYLVVAADKGTATFSDIANDISQDYGFWLGDAFASGGSAGYDHKKMGITARGAWESVKRHFRELGKDIQSEAFTVAGIGDMAGDVFGNGMLLSEHIQLVAAFNHQHIFIDPNPDTAASYQERKRLFNLPRSSWSDYNPELISKGGGIYSRQAKSIRLSAEMKSVLGAVQDACAPAEMINLILKSPVELLWNGGIGTYVKSSSETHNDAQDRNNDDVRADAAELRCKVIGEGGNLGMTQLARIEYARKGGLCYTDAIDNSAGVDTSDHEVNIKILLNAEMQKGRLSLESRNSLLAEMQQDIADLVLANNYLQTQILSLEASFSGELMPQQSRAILLLAEKGLLNPALEFLPDPGTLKDRFETGDYLTRPELAVLLSYSKMDLYQGLLDSSLPDEKYLHAEIAGYFPALIAGRYSKQIHSHRLKREIISTQITNNLVGTMGSTFHIKLSDLTGDSPDNIASAFIAARDILQIRTVIEEIQTLDNQAEASLQMQCLHHSTSALESSIIWILRNTSQPMDIKSTVDHYSAGYRQLTEEFEKAVDSIPGSQFQAEAAALSKRGIPGSLAQKIAGKSALVNGLDMVDIAHRANQPVSFVAQIYFGIAGILGLGWIERSIAGLKVKNIWDERSRFSLANELRNHHAEITGLIASGASGLPVGKRLSAWSEQNNQRIKNLAEKVDSLKQEVSLDFSMLSVVVSELNRLK